MVPVFSYLADFFKMMSWQFLIMSSSYHFHRAVVFCLIPWVPVFWGDCLAQDVAVPQNSSGIFDPLTLTHISGVWLSVSLEGWLISVFISKFVSIMHLKIKQWNVTAAKHVSSLFENSVCQQSLRFVIFPSDCCLYLKGYCRQGKQAGVHGGGVSEEAAGPERFPQAGQVPAGDQHDVHAQHCQSGGGAQESQCSTSPAGNLQKTGSAALVFERFIFPQDLNSPALSF